MILGSWEQVVDGVEFEPHSFRGHGWLYSHSTDDKDTIDSLLDKGCHEIPEGTQKKNGSIILKSSNARGAGQRQPPRRRGCCGRSG